MTDQRYARKNGQNDQTDEQLRAQIADLKAKNDPALASQIAALEAQLTQSPRTPRHG